MHQALVHILWNELCFYSQDQEIFRRPCITGINGFWCEPRSFKPPVGLHQITEYIGDQCDPYEQFKGRKPVWVQTPVAPWELKPWVYGRILRLDGLEEQNATTHSRSVYIHGNIHDWFFTTDNLQRSKGCIGLRLWDMVDLYDLLKSISHRILVYVEPTEIWLFKKENIIKVLPSMQNVWK